MKKLIITTTILAGLMVSQNFVYADYGCERKLQALEKQLSYAKKHGDSYRVMSLERGIKNVKTYCGGGYPLDSKEAKEYYATMQDLETLEKIENAKEDLAKAEYKLDKAKRKDDPEDIFEAEYKIKEAKGRIDMYEKYLTK